MPALDVRYVAGFFDGEGCIVISYSEASPKRSYRKMSLMVSVAQKNPEVLYLIRGMFGGQIQINKRTGCHSLRWSPRAGGIFLKEIYPYLVVKKKQAELALQYRALVATGCERRMGRSGSFIPEGRWNETVRIAEDIRSLRATKRGVPSHRNMNSPGTGRDTLPWLGISGLEATQ